jgi:hypothetical protein
MQIRKIQKIVASIALTINLVLTLFELKMFLDSSVFSPFVLSGYPKLWIVHSLICLQLLAFIILENFESDKFTVDVLIISALTGAIVLTILLPSIRNVAIYHSYVLEMFWTMEPFSIIFILAWFSLALLTILFSFEMVRLSRVLFKRSDSI